MRKTRKMRIYVGKCDINAGIQCNENKCGIAQAVQRRFPKSKIKVEYGQVKIGKTKYNLCETGNDFIDTFDWDKNDAEPCHIILTKV